MSRFRDQAEPPELVYVARSALLWNWEATEAGTTLATNENEQSEEFSLAYAKNNV